MSLFGTQPEQDSELNSSFDSSSFWEDLLGINTEPKQPDVFSLDQAPSDISQTTEPIPQPITYQYTLIKPALINASMSVNNNIKISAASLQTEEVNLYADEIHRAESAPKGEKYSPTTSEKPEIFEESEALIQQKINCLKEEIQKHNDDCQNESKNIADKKELRRLRNRFSAAISRANKKISGFEAKKQILHLENRIHALEEENKRLKIENAALRAPEPASKTLEFTTHTALRLSQKASSKEQEVMITTRHEVQTSPSKRKEYKY